MLYRALAEMIGTFILVLFGCGSVHVAVTTGALAGLGQVALVWAGAIMVAIFCLGGISGAHINPAMTLAFAVWGRFPWREVPGYLVAQFAGAFFAAATLFALFNPWLAAKEAERSVTRGQPGSELTAMCFGEYFPNPGLLTKTPYDEQEHHSLNQRFPEMSAMTAEFLGTLILGLVVFAVTDPRNPSAPGAKLAPVFIGLTVALLICVLAPLTQACFNPARDFGPRLFAYYAGWGEIAIPGPRGNGFFTVYILAPILGAIVGGGITHAFLVPAWQSTQHKV